MVLSTRERFWFIATLVAGGLALVYWFGLSPLIDWRADADARRDKLMRELKQTQELKDLARQLAPRWTEMVKSGMKNNPEDAENQVLHSIRDWSDDAGVSLSLVKPDRLTEKSLLPEISFQATGTGTLKSVARLLWHMQTASIPIKVAELQVNARKEGSDDLSFTLRVSTVYAVGPATPTTTAGAGGANPSGGRS
jgi:Tfp pilus assembly protein PilO